MKTIYACIFAKKCKLLSSYCLYISLLNKRFKKQSIIRVLKLTAATTVDQLISFKLRNRSELVTVDTRSKFRDYELLGQNLLLGLCH